MNYNDNIWGLDMEVLEEAYFGSKPEFKQIERLLGIVIERIHKQFGEFSGNPEDFFNLGYHNRGLGIYEDGTVEDLERLFKKAFKFKEFHLDFYYATPWNTVMNKNAFTMPTGFGFRDSAKNTLDKRLRGYENLTIGVCVGIDMIWSLQMTPRELMAIIMHEIGHNVDASAFTFLASLPPLISTEIVGGTIFNPRYGDSPTLNRSFFGQFIVGQVVKNIPYGAWMAKMNKATDEFLEKFPDITKTFQYLNMLIMELGQFVSGMQMLSQPIKFVKGLIKRDPRFAIPQLLAPQNVFGYGMEKFADSFASSYGYGKDMASISRKVQLSKWSVISNSAAEIPGINVLIDFMSVATRVSVMLLDPHPLDATRIYRQLVKLERDLHDPALNPKVRKELEQNVAELRQYIDEEILNPKADDNKKHVVTFMMNYFVIKVFNGRIDPRELYDSREL